MNWKMEILGRLYRSENFYHTCFVNGFWDLSLSNRYRDNFPSILKLVDGLQDLGKKYNATAGLSTLVPSDIAWVSSHSCISNIISMWSRLFCSLVTSTVVLRLMLCVPKNQAFLIKERMYSCALWSEAEGVRGHLEVGPTHGDLEAA